LKKRNLMALPIGLALTAALAGCGGAPGGGAPGGGGGGGGEEGASSFPEQEITVIIPYSPGGGNDTMARLVAQHMEKHLPNDATIVVENQEGGDSNIGLSNAYTAEPDGYTLGIAALPGNFVNQVLGIANYDLTQVEYVGYTANSSYMAVASNQSGFTTLEDLQGAGEVLAGIGSISSTDGLGVLIAADAMGFDVKTVSHEGSNEATLSVVRGDVDFAQLPYEGMKASVLAGELTPLWIYAEERDPDLPDVPTVAELGYEELLTSVSLHRVMFAPPGTPDDIMTILRAAFDDAVNSDEYKDALEQVEIPWNPESYERAEEVANGALEQIEPFEQILKDNS
jgi:tripartite-type tricarboxylate transporter receptor subunit TctC